MLLASFRSSPGLAGRPWVWVRLGSKRGREGRWVRLSAGPARGHPAVDRPGPSLGLQGLDCAGCGLVRTDLQVDAPRETAVESSEGLTNFPELPRDGPLLGRRSAARPGTSKASSPSAARCPPSICPAARISRSRPPIASGPWPCRPRPGAGPGRWPAGGHARRRGTG